MCNVSAEWENETRSGKKKIAKIENCCSNCRPMTSWPGTRKKYFKKKLRRGEPATCCQLKITLACQNAFFRFVIFAICINCAISASNYAYPFCFFLSLVLYFFIFPFVGMAFVVVEARKIFLMSYKQCS